MKNLKVFSKDMSNVHISKAVELARELEIYGEYELVAQFEKQDKKEDCLSVIAGAIKKRLESEVPSFSIHDDIIKIDTLEIIRILNKFCMAFLGYLSKNTISLLEDAVDKHLQNTKSVIGFDLKADVGIVPPLIHKTCKHTQGIVRVLESFGLTLAYCYCEDVSNPIYHRQKAMYGDCLYFYMFDIKVIVSSYNLPLYRLKKVPQILYINHVFNSVLKYLCWKKEEKYFYNAILEYRLLRCHYSLCHTKSEKKLLKLALEKYKISEHKIIKSGYPSFDESYKSFNFLNKTIGSGGGGNIC
ncbi:hypothetical protein B6S12_03180 [Helicobacter valdiviensis]|uniref:Uncharacterized protein n=1 Tax=Helicobacter valdiviensis TaxID=1458358 RepID=A0A2W6MXJ2_9HELI|nr:hypothetical protein [Helicobacter valdiviensis]PZT48651.1 hypothetical protein B6S12_03180 [Helicobacter valdiviensis]